MLDVHSIWRKEVEKACVDEQGLLTKIKYKKESYKRWEQDRKPRWGIQTHSLSTQGKPRSLWSWIWRGMWRTLRKLLQVPCSKRKTIEIVGPLLNGAGYLVTKDMEKTEVLSAYLQWRRIRSGNMELNWGRMRPLDLMGCTQALRELADIIIRLLLIVFERTGRTGDVPED